LKSRRFQKSYRANASKAHRALGEVLHNGVFSNYKIYQEYPVVKVFPAFQSGRHKFDWVILDLKVVVEVMGSQHQTPATFGGRSAEEAIEAFHQTQYNDRIKEQAAIDAGFTYIAIPHTDFKKISEPYLLDLIKEHYNEVSRQSNPVSIPNDNPYREAQKERARQYRKEQYSRRKAWLKSRKQQREVGDDVSHSQGSSEESSSTQDTQAKDTKD